MNDHPATEPEDGLVPDNLVPSKRPRVFKAGGEWVWICVHSIGVVGKSARGWADPWTAAMVSAGTHWAAQHDESGTVVEEGEL